MTEDRPGVRKPNLIPVDRRNPDLRAQASPPTACPLDHDPGQRVEADFGHIWVDFREERRRVATLLLTWAFSYAPFAIALPTERTEAILHGMVEGFEFFGCVPREVWWDNPTTVAVAILKGRQRQLNWRYAALASHYNFDPLFCMPARGNEKPYAENRVQCLERRWATPVPQVEDWAELNAYLRQCCLDDRQRIATGQTESTVRKIENSVRCRFPSYHAGRQEINLAQFTRPQIRWCPFANLAKKWQEPD